MTATENKEMTTAEREKKLLSTAGLAARARKALIGTELIVEGIRRGAVVLVLEAGDTSENTHKKLSDKAAFYGVRSVRLTSDGEALAHAFGKKDGRIAAVGITDAGIVRALLKYLPVSPEEQGSLKT